MRSIMSGNGALNAFVASTFGYDFVVIHSELFSNTYERNKDALAFIMGHELGHLRLGHTRLWYQLSTAYVDRVPLLGGFLSPGRYVYKEVDVGELLEQAQRFQGFWPVVAQLPQSHPFTVRRVKVLYDAGFFEASEENAATGGVVTTEI
jgi:Zn-dependent protease with chaperone function